MMNEMKADIIAGKDADDIYCAIEEFLFYLIKITWGLIMEYLPLKEYGYPQDYIFESIANHLCNNEKLHLSNNKPIVAESIYSDILALKLENLILREYMLENKMDPDLILLFREFCDRSALLYTISRKNEDYIIKVSPYIRKTNLKNIHGTNIHAEILCLNKLKGISELKSELKDIVGKCNMFIDKRFNKGYGIKKILNELQDEATYLEDKNDKSENELYLVNYFKSGNVEVNRIGKDLKNLAEQTGLSELNNLINKKKLKRKSI